MFSWCKVPGSSCVVLPLALFSDTPLSSPPLPLLPPAKPGDLIIITALPTVSPPQVKVGDTVSLKFAATLSKLRMQHVDSGIDCACSPNVETLTFCERQSQSKPILLNQCGIVPHDVV